MSRYIKTLRQQILVTGRYRVLPVFFKSAIWNIFSQGRAENSWPMVRMSKDVLQWDTERWDKAIIKPERLLLNLQCNELSTLTCQINLWTDERPSLTDNWCQATISGVFLSHLLYMNSCRCFQQRLALINFLKRSTFQAWTKAHSKVPLC